jgi:hypothetical protein
MTVSEPPSGTARAAPNSAFGLASALASSPPESVRPLERRAVLCQHDDHVPAHFHLAAGVLEDHLGHGDVALVRQIEARRDDLPAAPIYQLAHFFRSLVDEQQQQHRVRMVHRHRLGHGLKYRGLASLGRRDDEGPLPEPERADEIDHPLDLAHPRARRLRRLEAQQARGVHGGESGELRPRRDRFGGLPVHRGHAAVLQHHQVAAPQVAQPHARISPAWQVTVRGQAQRATPLGGIIPASNGRHGEASDGKIAAWQRFRRAGVRPRPHVDPSARTR